MLENKKLIQLIVSGVLALLFVNYYLKNQTESIEKTYGMVEVLSAARDIAPHTQVKESMLTTKQVPEKFMEPGAIMVKIPGEAMKRVVGKVTIAAIPSGAQILQSNLNSPSADATGVSVVLPPGKRGYLLRLGNLDVADLILPGNYIDIMATFTLKQRDGAVSKATKTILQNILVVSVGRNLRQPGQDVTTKKEGSASVVLTLALEPWEAERLSLAQSESQGEITVIVRPHGDNTINTVPVVTPSQLLDPSPRPPVSSR